MKHELKDQEGNVFFTLEYLEDKGIFYAAWFGSYLSVEQVKQGALLFLDEISSHPTSKLMNDNRQLEGVWDEANEWLATEWMPAVIVKGLKKFAHIYSPDLYARLSAEFMQDNSRQFPEGFDILLFDNQEDAEEWLMKEN